MVTKCSSLCVEGRIVTNLLAIWGFSLLFPGDPSYLSFWSSYLGGNTRKDRAGIWFQVFVTRQSAKKNVSAFDGKEEAAAFMKWKLLWQHVNYQATSSPFLQLLSSFACSHAWDESSMYSFMQITMSTAAVRSIFLLLTDPPPGTRNETNWSFVLHDRN